MIKKPVCDYENWDGVKYEEDKAMYRKLDGPKSRWSWGGWGNNYDAIDWSRNGKESGKR